MPAVIDEQPVAFALVHDLRVARDDFDARGIRGCAHGLDDPRERLHRQSFLDDEPRAQPPRARAAHREIVDCSVDRERADVAAGKEERAHDIRVGRKGDLGSAEVDHGAIVLLSEERIVERRQHQLFNELVHQPAAAAVREFDCLAICNGCGAAQDEVVHRR
jgi:hypothetical protein